MSPPVCFGLGLNDERFSPRMVRRRLVGLTWGALLTDLLGRCDHCLDRLGVGRRELAHGRRPGEQGFEASHRLSLVANQKLTVEQLANFDPAMRVRTAGGTWLDGKPPAAERDRVVVSDYAFVFEAQDVIGIQSCRPWAVSRRFFGRRHGKACIACPRRTVQGSGAGSRAAPGWPRQCWWPRPRAEP